MLGVAKKSTTNKLIAGNDVAFKSSPIVVVTFSDWPVSDRPVPDQPIPDQTVLNQPIPDQLIPDQTDPNKSKKRFHDQVKSDKVFLNRFLTFGDFEGLKSIPNLVFLEKINI
jgi:hypothetical protein